MSRWMIWGFVYVLLLGAGVKAEGRTSKAAAKTSVGKLAVLPDGLEQSARLPTVSVAVFENGKLIAHQLSQLRYPIVFNKVPVGAVEVVVIPWPSSFAASVTGTAAGRVTAEGISIIRVPLKRVTGNKTRLRILEADGNPIGAMSRLKVKDITGGKALLPIGYEMPSNDMGELVFYGFAGRSYQVVLSRDVGAERVKHTSQVLVGDNVNDGMVWKLSKVPMLRIRVFREIDGRRQIWNIDSLPLRCGKAGYSMLVRDGECSLPKGVGLLSNDSKVRVATDHYTAFASYEIQQNATFQLDDTLQQTVDVVFQPKRQGRVSFNISGLRPRETALGKVYVFEPNNARVVTAGSSDKGVVLPFGEYTAVVAIPGYRILEHKVIVADRKHQVVPLTCHAAKPLSGRIIDSSGKPVPDAGISIVYVERGYLPTERVRVDKKGAFQLPVDDREDFLLITKSRRVGGIVVRHNRINSPEPVVLRMRSPSLVSGSVTVVSDDKANQGSRAWQVHWANVLYPGVIVARSRVTRGRYEVSLQPGKYHAYVFLRGDAVLAGEEAYVVKEGEARTNMPPIHIAAEVWKTRKPLGEYLARY